MRRDRLNRFQYRVGPADCPLSSFWGTRGLPGAWLAQVGAVLGSERLFHRCTRASNVHFIWYSSVHIDDDSNAPNSVFSRPQATSQSMANWKHVAWRLLWSCKYQFSAPPQNASAGEPKAHSCNEIFQTILSVSYSTCLAITFHHYFGI